MSQNKQHQLVNGWIHRACRWLFTYYARIVYATYLRVIVKYQEALPTGSYLLVSNHQSHLDAIILGYLTKKSFNDVAFIAAKDYWYDHKSRRWLSNLFFNLIPISRHKSGGFTIRHTMEIVGQFTDNASRAVVILPEGTRSTNGKIKAFKPGAVALARECGLQIVPVYIHNSAKFWPKGKFLIKPGRMEVLVGKALNPNDLNGPEDLREVVLTLSKTYE